MNKDLHSTPGGPSGIHEDLLVKHLLGETSPEEQASVTAWLAADAANRHYFEHFRIIWRESRNLGANEVQSLDDDAQTEAAWQKFRQHIKQPSPLHAVKDHPSSADQISSSASHSPSPIDLAPVRPIRFWTRIAAVLLLVVGITAITYLIRQSAAAPDKLVASNLKVLTDTLPSGRVSVSTFKLDATSLSGAAAL